MNSEPVARKKQDTWTRADKVNGIGVLIALLGLVIGIGIPSIQHWLHYLGRPQAAIIWPINNERINDNTFGAHGTAKNIPDDSDLWLFLRSGIEGRWYPIKRLRVAGRKWSIGRKWICPVVGVQELIVYLIPNSEEGQLFAYQNSGAETRGVGLNSIPPYATVEATAYVEIPKSAYIGC